MRSALGASFVACAGIEKRAAGCQRFFLSGNVEPIQHDTAGQPARHSRTSRAIMFSDVRQNSEIPDPRSETDMIAEPGVLGIELLTSSKKHAGGDTINLSAMRWSLVSRAGPLPAGQYSSTNESQTPQERFKGQPEHGGHRGLCRRVVFAGRSMAVQARKRGLNGPSPPDHGKSVRARLALSRA